MDPIQHPEIGRELKARELAGRERTIVVLCKDASPLAVTVWVGEYSPLFGVDPNIRGVRTFIAGALRTILGLFQHQDDTMRDETGVQIHIYEYLGKETDGLQQITTNGGGRGGGSATANTERQAEQTDRKGVRADTPPTPMPGRPRQVRKGRRVKR